MKKCIFSIAVASCAALLSFGCADKQADTSEAAYLFAYFTGNDSTEEALRFAVSTDARHFYALNDNNPVLDSKQISSTGGIRDPHIMRGPDGKTFYMVMTDMVSANGWDSNRAMVLLKSTDLINWIDTVINIQDRFPGNEELKRVWAPQTIYDPEAQKLMIYWSMKHGDGPDIIYYAYANDSFTDLATEPKPLFIPQDEKSCIDGDIVEKDGLFHLFYKTEGHGNGIKVATTTSLTSGHWTEDPEYKQLTDEAVEGSGVFKLIGQDKYILMYDVYMAGRYLFTETSDLKTFSRIPEEITMDFDPRHGTIMTITKQELERLYQKWGMPEELDGSRRNPVIHGFHAEPDIIYSAATGKYYIYCSIDGRRKRNSLIIQVYSSSDLQTWTDEGTVADITSGRIKWAKSHLWCPNALEIKAPDGTYDYYLYFSARNTETGEQEIGAAHAKTPTGPFSAADTAFISKQIMPIDSGIHSDFMAFADPLSDKVYGYWGRGFLAVAELNPDMMSIDKETIKIITPDTTSPDGPGYSAAPYVLYRNATYYFIWSVGDPSDPNYHLVYGTSSSPTGPIKIAKNPILLSADMDNGICGVGYGSVVNIPGTNDYMVVYHRFNRNIDRIKSGLHREVCLDSIHFDTNGTIITIKPSA